MRHRKIDCDCYECRQLRSFHWHWLEAEPGPWATAWICLLVVALAVVAWWP